MFLLDRLPSYLNWANDAIWEIVETLTDDEFTRPLAENVGSIRRRYIHLAQDTWEWYHDWHNEEPEEPDFQSMARRDLYQFTVSYLNRWQSLIEDMTIDQFTDERAGKTVVITFNEMFFHLVNHFTYHRGQIVMGLKMLGKDVIMTDYVPYRFSTA